jgi:16S rRNA (uracil1498-N3)-methyltransferase
MQFTYHISSGTKTLKIAGDLHKYLFKIRRQNIDKNLFFRNLIDHNIYEYKILSINKNYTLLDLINKIEKSILPVKKIHLGWCIIDNKNIEKYIASLNEIGISKITFIKCKYTQNKYKINFKKIDKLLYNSSSQCGRSNIIKLDTCNSLEEFITNNPDTYMFNFSKTNINIHKEAIETIVLGCEGGFSTNEINMINDNKIVGCNINTILKSETSAVSVASILLG